MDFDGYSDASLLALMAIQEEEEDAEIAKEALGELFERHSQFLTPVVTRVFGSMLGGAKAAEDMVVEVFWRVYEHCGRAGAKDKHYGRTGAKDKADDFESKFHGADLDRSRKSVRAWLSRVAENMFRDLLRQSERAEEFQLDGEVISLLEAPDDAPQLSPERVELVGKALEALTEVERDALVACLPWYDPATGEFDMGKDARIVAESLGKTVGSVKKARRRAVDHLRELGLPLPSLASKESRNE